MVKFKINGQAASSDAPPATPLLWVIREGLKLSGTKYGCGAGLCGACMVHKQKPHPTREEIVEHMSAHICRCGTYPRIVRAIERAAREG
jgi:aerobic-type carbon monoxide dehydrogenase small subunit (CoxS/CutS family)